MVAEGLPGAVLELVSARLLTLVEAGDEVVIARYGKGVARLVRVAPAAKR